MTCPIHNIRHCFTELRCHMMYIEGRVVRAVCSDADKVEAIGLVGIQRCLQYSAEVMQKKGNANQITPEILISQLVEHGNEKLFILMDEYIVTEAGKALAKPSHDAMMAEVVKLEAFITEAGGSTSTNNQQRQSLDAFEGGKILLDVLKEQ